MNSCTIKAESLSKHFFIPNEEERLPRHLREAITLKIKRLLRAKEEGSMRQFIALDDVSFSIDEGERVGVMGVNGAGKSTLMRILSGISKPSSGRAEIRGRLSTVLEIGLGFHDELSGKENIYMMGALYGMQEREIRSQFDSIVDFADISGFLRTPLKFYSSGMRARLGFAVSAHLRADVMLLDEALAVGDSAFQKKCIAKMHDIANEGRTVLLVSHSEVALQTFCSRALLLDKGKLVLDTRDIAQALQQYTQVQKNVNPGIA